MSFIPSTATSSTPAPQDIRLRFVRVATPPTPSSPSSSSSSSSPPGEDYSHWRLANTERVTSRRVREERERLAALTAELRAILEELERLEQREMVLSGRRD